MDITSLGHSSFRIRGKAATVVTDPYDPLSTGLKFPKNVEADVVTISHGHDDHNSVSQIMGAPFVIQGPGEYEVKGVGVVGVSTYHDNEKGASRGRNAIYRIEIDGVAIVHLGDLGHTLTTAEVDELGGVDILMVPVGGVYSLDAAQAVAVVNEIDPSIVIPMHYGRSELDQKIFGQLQPVSAFLKEIGKEAVPQAKLSITKDKLPDQMQVVVLE
jgi:L-ascorbate metabolism protein UlaG (beta-lactamase superfamily)